MPKSRNEKLLREVDEPNYEDDIDMLDDIDKFHLKNDNIDISDEIESEIEPVFGIDSSEDDEKYKEVIEDALEDNDDSFGDEVDHDNDDISRNFWGTKKSVYYNSDSAFLESKKNKGERKFKVQKEMERKELFRMEEEEALFLQRQMIQELKDEDFGLDYIKEMSSKFEAEKMTVDHNEMGISNQEGRLVAATHLPRDLSQLTIKQKKKLLNKESPELLTWGLEVENYINELKTLINPILGAYQYKEKMILKFKNQPKHKKLMGSLESLRILNPDILKVLSMKRHIISLYLINFSFYLYLKSKSLSPLHPDDQANKISSVINVYAHPVILRLKSYKKLLDTLESKIIRCHIVQLQTLAQSCIKMVKIHYQEKSMYANRNVRNTRNNLSKLLGYDPIECHYNTSFNSKVAESNRSLNILLEDDLSKLFGLTTEKPLDAERIRSFKTTVAPSIISKLKVVSVGGKKVVSFQDKGHGSFNQNKLLDKMMDVTESVTSTCYSHKPELDGKRAINYEMAKNKGLTPKRKKEYRNPRVKHKIRFRKALIKRKSQVRIPRTENTKYGGEMTGIKIGLKRSIKIR